MEYPDPMKPATKRTICVEVPANILFDIEVSDDATEDEIKARTIEIVQQVFNGEDGLNIDKPELNGGRVYARMEERDVLIAADM